jgi:prepilin-type N-terminal cleavage/methylation domain-containing protein
MGEGTRPVVAAAEREAGVNMRARSDHVPSKSSGFTLVELLIVTVIVAVLAAIAISLYLGQREKAKDAAVKEGVWAVQSAVVSWSQEHNDLYPDPVEVAAGGAVGQYLDRWPDNPWTGVPMVDAEDYSRGDFHYAAWDGQVVASAAPELPDYESFGLIGWTSNEAEPYVARAIDSEPLTSLGSTFKEISGSMIGLLQEYYAKYGKWPRSWDPYGYTDLGLDPDEWSGYVDHIKYTVGGSKANVRPEAGWVMDVAAVDGTTRKLTANLNWNLVYDATSGKWYYHRIEPANEIDISTLVLRPQ